MWVLVPDGQALKVAGGTALMYVVPMDQVAILPTVTTPAPVTATPPVVSPALAHQQQQQGPTQIAQGSNVTVQLVPSP